MKVNTQKKTLLLIEAIKRSTIKNDGRLLEWISKKEFNNTEKLNDFLSIFNDYDIKPFALQQRDAYVQKSVQALESISLDEPKKAVLKSLVDYLVLRDF